MFVTVFVWTYFHCHLFCIYVFVVYEVYFQYLVFWVLRLVLRLYIQKYTILWRKLYMRVCMCACSYKINFKYNTYHSDKKIILTLSFFKELIRVKHDKNCQCEWFTRQRVTSSVSKLHVHTTGTCLTSIVRISWVTAKYVTYSVAPQRIPLFYTLRFVVLNLAHQLLKTFTLYTSCTYKYL